MLKRARRAGLVPALVVTVVVAISLVAPAAANRFNSLAAVCGYGYGYPAAAPTVTSVAPNFGPPSGGTTVTITGTGFCGTITAVMFGATAATGVTTLSDTQATAVSPAHAAGTVDVTVTTTKGTSATGPGDKFTFVGVTVKQCSTLQYTLTGSNAATWMTIDAANLSILVAPSVDSFLVVTGNADLWTSSAGFNQDLGITVVGGTSPSYPSVSGQPEAWKESGGFAGTFSPNAAAVQTVLSVKAGQTYAASLQWKSNIPDSGTIWAGAGPIGTMFSQTCIIGQLVPVSAASEVSKVSTSQYRLTGSNGQTYTDLDLTNLSLAFTAPANGVILLSGNADLWTINAGFNQDIALNVNGSVNAWKESGGFAGTFSPNAAFVQSVVPVTATTVYNVKLQWKSNIADSGTIFAGAGPVPAGSATYSPTRLTLTFLPTASAAIDEVSTSQYTLQNNNGKFWSVLDITNFNLIYTPTATCIAIVSANVDLWTANAGFNQDIGIFVNDTTFPTTSGQPEGWKESGGFAGTFSPNAAYLQIVVSLTANTPYSIQLVWKANINAPNTTLYAGAGPWPAGSATFSPTRLTLQPIGC